MPGTPARRFGAFEALELLVGKGGQGRLFAARCLEDGVFDGLHAGDEVVLKAMPVRADDPEKAYRRLTRRTTALVAARHPGIVRYYGCFETEGGGIDDAMHVVVMELLHGETLEERLKREPLGLDGAEGLAIIRICLEALVHAASFGIVHRDIKPSNIFLCDDGGVKLIDFEVARQATSAQTTTESGAMQGTFDYMAPDFHPNFRPDPKFRGDQCSDVFSLAVTLHEMLTGRRPYAAGPTLGDQSMMAFFQRWTKADGVDPRRAVRVDGIRVHALRHLQRALRKALQPNRAERFQTYADFLAALENVEPRILEGGIDRYRLSKCVGKGGFGVVYKAFRESNGAAVAVKVLLRAEYAERFDREGRVLMKFDDDRIVPFVEAFAAGDPVSPTHFLVMGFLAGMPGSSLKDRLGAEPSHRGLPRSEVVPAFVRFAGGLQVLHDEGVYHRDIKPANLYCPAGEPERACLMDLGVVRTEETHTNGGLPGTLDYMAPELATGGSRGDALSDVYALGLCLYEALTGRTAYPRLPRGSEGVAAFYARAQAETPPDLSGLEDEPELLALLRSMTAVRPGERPVSAARTAALLRAVPVRETATAAEADAAAVASGSEDSTDDLVFPVPTASAAATPPEPVPAGEPEAETAAAVPDGETQALPPAAAAEDETQAVPAAAAEAGETQAIPDERRAESASAAEDETQAVVSGTPPAEGETAAMPEAAAAEDGETQAPDAGAETQAAGAETQATNVAETAATAALDASETLATRATQATQATQTAQVTETVRPRRGVPPSDRKKTERPRPIPGGIREIKPNSGPKSFFAAAAVLILCGLATCAILFQKDIERYFETPPPEPPIENPAPEPPSEQPVGPSATPDEPKVVESENNSPAVPDKPGVVEEPPTSPAEPVADVEKDEARKSFEKRISGFEENTAPPSLGGMIELDGTAKTLLTELKEANFEAADEFRNRNRIEKKLSDLWNSFVSGRIMDFSKRISDIQPGQTLFEQATNELSTIETEIEQVPESHSTRYTDLLEEIGKKKTELLARKEHDDALADARAFQTAVSKAKNQKDRTDLKASISFARKNANNQKGWEDVVQACDKATEPLDNAIKAFERVETAVTEARTAKDDFDKLADSYAKLAKTGSDLPSDAETLRTDAMAEIKGKLEKKHADFDKRCGNESDKDSHKKNVDEARKRSEDDRLPATVRDQYAKTLSRITGNVELTVENAGDVPISVTVGTETKTVKTNGTATFPVERWSKQTVEAKAGTDHPEDYENRGETVETGNGRALSVSLNPKQAPVLSVPSNSNVPLEASLDGIDWKTVPCTFEGLEPRKTYDVQWRIHKNSHPEDFETGSGKETAATGNRGTSKTIAIPAPELKKVPTIVFSVSDLSAPALKATVGGKTATFSGKKTDSISLEPRQWWTASFEWGDENGKKWWMPVEKLDFETTNRGTVLTNEVKVAKRPVVEVENEGEIPLVATGKLLNSGEAVLFPGKPLNPGEAVLFPGLPDDTIQIDFTSTSKDADDIWNLPSSVKHAFGMAGSRKSIEVKAQPSGEKIQKRIKKDNYELLEDPEGIDDFMKQLSGFTASGFSNNDKDSITTAVSNLLEFVDNELKNDDNMQASDWVAALNGARLAFFLSSNQLNDTELQMQVINRSANLRLKIDKIKNAVDNEAVKRFKKDFPQVEETPSASP